MLNVENEPSKKCENYFNYLTKNALQLMDVNKYIKGWFLLM